MTLTEISWAVNFLTHPISQNLNCWLKLAMNPSLTQIRFRLNLKIVWIRTPLECAPIGHQMISRASIPEVWAASMSRH